ncbi:TPA: nuclear transport factor 2 family protein [Burkholderia cenocepacia]|uniref:nuclear transport factor 2 family protein n=1 Tax=Burkholderia cepacia complex TaxID=87882 RepID=UPI00098FB0BA|nr:MULTISPECIES: nuclear transport factor 2 family protein [Burkholderia cepacia complex]AQT53752.1 hypothetical protein BHQ31_27710 [Burkholderia cenocepacia]HEM7902024.1 nuclear transport factor 2 family protein [Burkholderia cenocepacia]
MSQVLRSELEARVSELNKAWPKRDANTIQREFFSPQAWIAGEGMPAAAHDAAGVVATLQHMFKQAPYVEVEVVSASAFGSAISSWLHWRITDAGGTVQATMRSLTLWERVDGRLVISGDSFSAGEL